KSDGEIRAALDVLAQQVPAPTATTWKRRFLSQDAAPRRQARRHGRGQRIARDVEVLAAVSYLEGRAFLSTPLPTIASHALPTHARGALASTRRPRHERNAPMMQLPWKSTMPSCAKALAIAALATLGLSLPASADDAATAQAQAPPAAAVEEGSLTTPVFLVPYWRSEPGISTVVSITNLGTTPCLTTVDWRNGLNGEVQCRTSLTIAGGTPVGSALEHCTRGTFVLCDSTCDQSGVFGFRGEGNAVVGTESRCKNKIAVDARAYYERSTEFEDITAVADLKVIRLPSGNKGD